MTLPSSDLDRAASPPASAPNAGNRGRRRWLRLLLVAAIGLAATLTVAGLVARGGDDGEGWQTGAIGQQGQPDTPLAERSARIQRRADGVAVEVVVPTPAPGSYEYPTGDMIPPTAEPHPPVDPGAGEVPEVFSLWLFVFNDPSRCTDGTCDADDFQPGAAARGGVYQVDGRVGDADELRFEGNIRLGQRPADGAPLDDPERAEVHLAIAPHGRQLPGEDGWRQLNGPVGNPTLWWATSFS